jgi:hypothetical protein
VAPRVLGPGPERTARPSARPLHRVWVVSRHNIHHGLHFEDNHLVLQGDIRVGILGQCVQPLYLGTQALDTILFGHEGETAEALQGFRV